MIAELIERCVEAADRHRADALVFSNLDIAPVSHFYVTAASMLEDGHDAIVINRRNISTRHTDPVELPKMWAEVGEGHPGHDCFVVRPELLRRIDPGGGCVGAPWVMRPLLLGLMLEAEHFVELRHAHLTFHLGDDPSGYADRAFAGVRRHNRRAMRLAIRDLEQRHDPLHRHPLTRPHAMTPIRRFRAGLRSGLRWALHAASAHSPGRSRTR